MANVADLQSKYSKLAQEYSKLRAQNQVLKKAVVDEQTASCSLKVSKLTLLFIKDAIN
uniref:Protein phosphatase 1 regulatory subunit 21 N-terminal domain-containing protein n=1 Tax=Sinocyclocheilus rhinocerous TaxID=307959 RepID=A0A673HEN1_9TELE